MYLPRNFFTILRNKPTVISTFCKCLKHFRNYGTVVEKELDVSTFCDIEINVPHNVRIKPLNVHEYQNCDKVIIHLNKDFEHHFECVVNGDKVNIIGHGEANDEVLCSVEAPVKANLNVKSQNNISVGSFKGSKISLHTTKGNIFVDKFEGSTIDVFTVLGDVTLSNYIQAENITVNIEESGSIHGGRMQGSKLEMKTSNGNIDLESAYCTESVFVVGKGNMNLDNIHNSCWLLLNEGQLNMSAFDGQLTASIQEGDADIHLCRINGDSNISLSSQGSLKLKLSENCIDYSRFSIKADNCQISRNIKYEIQRTDNNVVLLIPSVKHINNVNVDCECGDVLVESASWQDVIRMKIERNSIIK